MKYIQLIEKQSDNECMLCDCNRKSDWVLTRVEDNGEVVIRYACGSHVMANVNILREHNLDFYRRQRDATVHRG